IGAITIYIAAPFRPGDFIRVGTRIGTVTDIGLRSTYLRTLDRTIVNIPNGPLASAEIENITLRDSIRFYRMIALRLSTTPDQMRYVMAKVREILYAHPSVITDSISVRFNNIDDSSLALRLDSRIDTTDYQTYLAVGEDIYLRIIDAVRDSGAEFAFPSQTVMLEEPLAFNAGRKTEIEALVEQWRQQDSLPYPNWPEEHIDEIENTLDYPPSGTPYNPRNKGEGDDDG
ncbi:MAG: mechanosensitive ion channel domain-containing protein, partial [Pseudomonadales bacterium]